MRESARESLNAFWQGVIDLGALTASLSQAQRRPLDLLFGGFGALSGEPSASQMMTDAMTSFWSKTVSPYQSNPLDINPLKTLLEKLFDHSENPEWVYEHVWRPHDLVVWDNRCSMHARTDFPEGERRLMLRTTIEADTRPH